MRVPQTTLDTRFSEPNAVADWDETRLALEAAQLFWITTVRPDGRPHVTPLVAVWLDEAMYFATGPSEQKALNLGQNPHVILTTGCNAWDHGIDIVLEGTAVRITDEQHLEKLADAWTRKWDGRWRYKVGAEGFEHEKRRRRARLRRRAHQGHRLRQGHLQPNTAPLLPQPAK